MPQPWHPEHPVDADLARRLVALRMPELAGAPVHLGAGWDIDVWRFGDLAVRFPRRAAGIVCLDNELAILPLVADRLPLPVPRPTAIGEPALGYPSRFYAHPYLPGAPANRVDVDLARLAAPIGRFLRALHAIALPFRADPRAGIERIAERARDRLDGCELAPALHARVAAILAAPPPDDGVRCLVHGDLHAGNVLVADDGAPTAVIDWGDAAIGDPALDLAIAWSALPASARGEFLAAYGDVPPTVWARAGLIALAAQGIALLRWGKDLGDARVISFAHASIERAIS